MARKKEGKEQTREQIDDFFNNKGKKSEKDVKKIKRLAMAYNIKLGKFRQRFCKRCYSFFSAENCKIRIEKKRRIIRCLNCDYINRIKT